MKIDVLENKRELYRLYIDEKLSVYAIATSLGVGSLRVKNALLEFGVPIRDMSEAISVRNLKMGKWQGEDNPARGGSGHKKYLEGIKKRDFRNKKNPMFGKTFSEKTKALMRRKKIKKHTPLYQQIRNSSYASRWSRDILKRDEYTCQNCGKVGGYLEAHHIVGFSVLFKEFNIKTFEQAINTPELWSLNNGITLCKECHKNTDNYGGRG